MIITLIKNGESFKEKSNKLELTTSGASQLMRSAVMLVHFSGHRPLFAVDNYGNYSLSVPQTPINSPSLILTGNEDLSKQSGKVINEVFSQYDLPKVEMRSSCEECYPQSFLSNNNNSNIKHLVVIGSEPCLNKWATFICKNSENRSSNSDLCIINDGHLMYDSKENKTLYMIDGIMDSVLVESLNANQSEEMSKLLENAHGLEAGKLEPFRKKIRQLPDPISVLYKISQQRK